MKKLCVGVLMLYAAIAIGQNATPTYPHVKYADGENNWLNIYQADGKKPAPVLVWAHANGKAPSANEFPNSTWQQLKAAGISVISWESIPNVLNADHVATGEKDFLTVMDWVQANAAKYNLDAHNIIVSGRSRGTVLSFMGVNQLSDKIKGVYFVQTLPNGAWALKDYRNFITQNSPKLVMAYADAPGTTDAHTPLNGVKIADKYKSLGIGDRVKLYHSLGKDSLYKYLIPFIKETTK